MDVLQPVSGMADLLSMTTKVTVVFVGLLLVVAYTTYAERRISAFIQDRVGPNRVGPFGLLQPIADGIKNFLKEETLPARSHKLFFLMGPVLAMAPAMVIIAVIPFAAPLNTPWGVVDMVAAILRLCIFNNRVVRERLQSHRLIIGTIAVIQRAIILISKNARVDGCRLFLSYHLHNKKNKEAVV